MAAMSQPPRRAQPVVIENHLQVLTHALDGLFRVPGTQWRFGLDGLIGLIPGVGDAITSLASFTLLLAAVRYRVPKIAILRMGLNLAIDYAVGALPLVGDAFDFVWKANQRNLAILQSHATVDADQARLRTTGDYLFVFGVIGGLVALLIAAAAVAVWILAQLLDALG